MLSAIVGDIIGSTFEVENHRSIYFETFRSNARFTDDTVCTLAVADILLKIESEMPEKTDSSYYINSDWASNILRNWCAYYLNRGFGSLFYQWISNGVNVPYKSYGNGALMRISPVAKFGHVNNWTLDKTIKVATDITNLTHNHNDAIRAVSCYIEILFLLLKNNENAKDTIANTLEKYGYYLSKTISEYRIEIDFDLTCETSLLVACQGIIESENYLDTFHLIVSVGGDSDTYCAIAGPIAETIWGVEDDIYKIIKSYFKENDKKAIKLLDIIKNGYK